jgi:WD40 repeat protein
MAQKRRCHWSARLVARLHNQAGACATSAVLLFPCITADSPMQAVKTLASHTDWIAGIAWHPQSPHHLATASHDSTVKLWDTRAAVPLHTITGHTDKVIGVCHATCPSPPRVCTDRCCGD